MTSSSSTDEPKFAPAFAMPVIAPPPAGYPGAAAAYYADVALQAGVTRALVPILPEQLLGSSTTPASKGLLITIGNPDASFPPPAVNPPLLIPPPPPPFGTLFALMGGELIYRPASDPLGLNSLLPSPFQEIPVPVQYPPPADLITPAWGTLLLRLWGTDLRALQDALPSEPIVRFVYYVGVDQASLEPLLKPVLKEIYSEQDYLDYLTAESQRAAAEQKKAPIRQVAETIRFAVYPSGPTDSIPSYNNLIDDYFDAFLAGGTSLLVKGGTAIGKAIQVNTPGFPDPLPRARVELWFLDTGAPPEFISPAAIINAAPTYGF